MKLIKIWAILCITLVLNRACVRVPLADGDYCNYATITR